MIPPLDAAGNLPAGIHWATWIELVDRFGTSPRRIELLGGLKRALQSTGETKGIIAIDLKKVQL